MDKYRFTAYFENEILRKRPYIRKEWCVRVIENPLKIERQENDRFRFWGTIEELGEFRGRACLPAGNVTRSYNAFPDRRFKL